MFGVQQGLNFSVAQPSLQTFCHGSGILYPFLLPSRKRNNPNGSLWYIGFDLSRITRSPSFGKAKLLDGDAAIGWCKCHVDGFVW